VVNRVLLWLLAHALRLRRLGVVALVLLAIGASLVLGAMALLTSTAIEIARFQRAEGRRTTFVYAAAQTLAPGVNVRAVDLAGTLTRLRYAEVPTSALSAPGQFRRAPGAWEVYRRGDDFGGAPRPSRVRLLLTGDRITRVVVDTETVESTSLEPEVLTSAYDRPGEDYRPVRLAEVPLTLLNAVIAAEDHRFFEHGGLDVHGLARAFWANLRAGRVTQGGSTITQQLVKNRLVGSQRTYARKLHEAWLATAIEWRYSKEQILEAYINDAYMGQRGPIAIRGMGAAARAYFHKEIHQLTLAESALLAGMIRAPNSYSPVLNPERARQRRDVVLARMHELGRITDADYGAARREALRRPASGEPGQAAPYFADYVRQELEQQLGEDLRAGRVLTTVDLALQRFAEAAVRRGLERLEASRPRLKRADAAERLQAALVVLDARTGEIRALVGGRNYQASQFNRAILARRQPGSAFKPFVYLAALGRHDGGGPAFTAATFVDDSPVSVQVGADAWSPRNYEDHYEGRVTVRRALEGSLNAATVRIAQEIGLPAVIGTARQLGITSALRPVPAVVLGAFEVSPLELARAYVPLANGGIRPEGLSAVSAVWDADGSAVKLPPRKSTQVVDPAETYLVTSILQSAMISGTAAAAHSLAETGSVAGKTGTTNDARDAWFVGYTPSLVALVWVGFDNGDAAGLSGAQAALPIWEDFMRQTLAAYPVAVFAPPPGVTVLTIDATNGRAATRWCPVTAQEVFLTGTEPPPCQEHGWVGDQVIDWWRRFRDWFRR
jgi:penicillin-binding protein 1B